MSTSSQTVSCSGTFNFYDSGGSAGDYLNNESYTVTFHPATAGQCIQINFSAFATESCCDFFRAFDGPNAQSPQIGNYSGTAIPPNITSSGGPLTVVFTSDFSVVAAGWAALVSCVVCPPPPPYYLMNNTNTTLTCPPTFSLFYDSGGSAGNYSNNENFTKTFFAPAGSCLQFSFGSFATENCCDRLRIYDGPNAASPLIGNYGGATSPGIITSSGSSITFSFTSDGSIVNSGWTATITCPPPCSGTPNTPSVVNQTTPCPVNGSVTLVASNLSIGCGIINQWQFSTSTSGPWTNNTALSGSSVSVSAVAGTYYRLVSACGSNSAISNVVALTTFTPGCQLGSYSPTQIGYSFDTFVGTVLPTTDDVLFNSILLFGFPFCYSGNSFAGAYVASNCAIVFDAVPCFPNIQVNTYAAGGVGTGYTIPNPAPVNGTSIPRNAILGPWHDTDPSVGGIMRMGVLGTTPNRRFVVSYENVPMFSFGCNNLLFTGQIKLFETTNDIEIHIGNKPLCTGWNSGRAVLGLHNFDGSQYVPPVNMTAHNSPTHWTMTNTAYRFTSSCPAQSLCATPLPIGFSNIYGQNFGAVNNLWWEVSDLSSVQEFIIERSPNGIDFDEIGRKEANLELAKYLFEDNNFKTGVINYYRVGALHDNGNIIRTSLYPIYSLDDKVLITAIFPNPASDKLNIGINGSTNEDFDFCIYDQFGKLMWQETKKVHPGLSNVEVNIDNLIPGLYIIEVKSSDKAIVSKQKFSKM